MLKYSLLDRSLRFSYLLVAAADALIGLIAVFTPPLLAATLGLPIPTETFYFRWAGLFTAVVATIYLLAGVLPTKYYTLIVVSVLVRVATAAFLFFAVRSDLAPRFFLKVLLLEAILIVHHIIFALRFAPGRVARSSARV
jgi:hypothetical protein